jgi:hypothetical protein
MKRAGEPFRSARDRRVLRSSAVAEEIYVGNAATDGAARGWLLGHFMPQDDPRNSDDVEIKWGVHPEGERRPGWVTDDPRSMLSVLVSGRFRIDLPNRSVVLAEPGDYIVFHGVNHTWHAEEASVVVSVRWPSLPGFDLAGVTEQA